MVGEIRRGKLYADREEASGENDAHDFKSDDTAMIAPCAGIEHVCAVWAHDDAHRGSEDDFVDIELIPVPQSVSEAAANEQRHLLVVLLVETSC